MIGVFYRAPEPGARAVRRGRRGGRGGADAVPARGDEALQRAQGRDAGRRARDPRRERRAGRVRAAPVRARAARSARRSTRCDVFDASSSRTAARSRCASSARCTSSASRRSPCTRRPTRTRRSSAWPTARCASARRLRRQSYLSIPSLIAAATTTGCEAVHPGWGFLAENPAFARACDENELVFIGPTPDVMARMGDKAQAKRELRAAGVPLVPGTEGTATIEQARTAARRARLPVLLKAAAGGGGKGMRLVESLHELEDAFGSAAAEAQAAFGDPRALRREGDRSRRATSRCRCSADAARRRAHARRARVLDPAPAPEADRGVAVAGADAGRARGDGGRRRARGAH